MNCEFDKDSPVYHAHFRASGHALAGDSKNPVIASASLPSSPLAGMQGFQWRCFSELTHLDLSPGAISFSSSSNSTSLSIDGVETAEDKIQRLISEHPVIIFSRSACCMCHAMKKLLATIGVNPTVIELDDDEIGALPVPPDPTSPHAVPRSSLPPAVFIGGSWVGGLESLVALHLSGHLVPKLVEIGALWV
ncbi:hypothetical protein SAY87_026064 [Trapa incisa]|uniref:Glutaredoxin domain-containing protein n=1 Tax=Trapa incisa TaxID=236973 RepID=A0AAN7H226_9MYRT|nr:hypothetical protein SAY87_026064 [Trapa incisa]